MVDAGNNIQTIVYNPFDASGQCIGLQLVYDWCITVIHDWHVQQKRMADVDERWVQLIYLGVDDIYIHISN